MSITKTSKRLTPSGAIPKIDNSLVRIEHYNPLWDDVSALITQVNLITAGFLYQGTLTPACDFPAAVKDQFWLAAGPGTIGVSTVVETGDEIICIVTSAGGGTADADFMVVQKNMIPCTVTVLRAGTNNTDFVTAKTFNDQKITFDANYNLGLTKSVVADDITTPNLVTYRDITGTLNGGNATLSTKNIYSTTDITLANTTNETALYAGDCGLGYWSGQMQFTHNGAGAIALDYWPDAFRLNMGSTPIDGGGGGTITIDSWIWGIYLDSYVGGAAGLSTIHSDSWNFQSAFTTTQTANTGVGDWSGFYSDINGINDPLVSAYGFRSELRNVINGAVVTGFYSDIDVLTASTANQSLFSGVFYGDRDTANTDSGLLISFGDPITPETYTLDDVAGVAYGIRIAALATGFVHTNGAFFGIHENATTTYTQSATCFREAMRLAGYWDSGINFGDGFLLMPGADNAMIDIGTWNNPIVVSSQTAHYAPIQVHLDSNTSVNANITAARFRVDTIVANTLTNVYGIQIRNSIANDVASFYGCHASANVGAIVVQTGAIAVGSFYLEGTGAITPAGANPIDVVNATNVHSGAGVSNVLNICNNTASAVGSVATFSNLSGAVTNMIYINNANTTTYGINMAGLYGTGINMANNVVNAANANTFIYNEKTLTGVITADRTSSGNAVTFRVDTTNTTAGDFDMHNTGNAMVIGISHVANTTTGAKTDADTCSIRGLYMDIDAICTNAIDKLTMTTPAILVDYTVTQTAGALEMNDLNIIGIEYNTAGTFNYQSGTYSFFSVVATDASTPTCAATTYLSAYRADLSALKATDADLYLNGLMITTPTAGGSTVRAISLAGAPTAHIYSSAAMIVDMPVTAPGAGFDTANGVKYIPYGKRGASGMFVEEIYIDLQVAAVTAKDTDHDIIGEAAGGAAYIGQITAALNGTVQAIEVICLEVPTGGSADIDLYSATEGTGAYDTDVTALTEVQLIDANGNWTLGMVKATANLPAGASDYLYLANGAAAGAGAYTAGKFLIRIYGI